MFTSRYHKPGAEPATLQPREGQGAALSLIYYDGDRFDEEALPNAEALFDRLKEIGVERGGKGVCWVNIEGLGDMELLRKVGQHFGLHPLALEDVTMAVQRPKVEEYDDHLFIVMQVPHGNGPYGVIFEQVSLFYGATFLISIQEEPRYDVFEMVRTRLRSNRGFGRTRGHDYLAYALIDAVVDHFFPILEPLGESIEKLEDVLLKQPSQKCMKQLHDLKRALLLLRRNAWPLREVVNALTRDESGLVTRETRIFLRDCYDHSIQIMDVIEGYRDLSTSMMDIYLSSLGVRTNEIMRVLTVVSTVFIPLTFIAGVYGMNFKNMPELAWRYGYAACLLVMALLAIGMLGYFRSKRWL